jgi:hypothetical protein
MKDDAHYEKLDIALDEDNDKAIEQLVDVGYRHHTNIKLEQYVQHWIRVGRRFGYATKDLSPGEFEKTFAIMAHKCAHLDTLVKALNNNDHTKVSETVDNIKDRWGH